ncbi:MAG TPA: helical backbone metal receptor [Flavitalea sp.]|nr:helical backbone metal receptor [Flavitalea sp.]
MLLFQEHNGKRKLFPFNTFSPALFPQRIVSLVPSQTELLYHLGLDQRVVGITKFCIRPDEWFSYKTRVGGTKSLNIELIRELNPDLIIANKEENDAEQTLWLSRHYPVWVSDIKDMSGALDMILTIGALTGTAEKAADIVRNIQKNFGELRHTRLQAPPRAAYLMWRNPYMAAGGDTFIHDMMSACGWTNAFADLSRYPAVSPEQLANASCDMLLLSSEPYPFREKHIVELKKIFAQYAPGREQKTMFLLVDGEMFSWYGSRLIHAAAYFKRLSFLMDQEQQT